MSLPRVALVCAQTLFNELACTPPNPTQPKHRYHTEEPTFFQIAPLILRLHQFALRIICFLEILSYLAVTESPLPLPFSGMTMTVPSRLALNTLPPNPSPLFLAGTLLVAIGALLRVASFRALGEMFTFDLTIHPHHRLITSGPYAYVRHPAYTGTLCIIAGLVASHMTPGSFLGIALGGVGMPAWMLALCRSTILLSGAVWWTWMLGVGLSRIPAEEKKMAALFPAEWAEYEKRSIDPALPVRFFILPLASTRTKTPTMSGKGKALTPRPALNKAKKEAQAARRKRIQAGIVVAVLAWGAYATVTSKTGAQTVAGACRSWAGGSFAPELDPTTHPLSAWSLPENITLFHPPPSSNEPTCLPWSNQRQVYRTPSADSPADAGPLTAFAADALIVVPRAALNDTFVLLRRNLGMGPDSKTVQETGKITYSVPEEDVEAPDGDDDVPVTLAVFHSDPEVLAGMRICRLAKVGEEGKVVGVGLFRDPTYDTPQCPWSSTPPADEPITRWIHVAAAVRFPLTDDGSPIAVRRFVTELGTGYAQDFSEIWEKGQQIEFLSGSVEGQDVARVGGEDGEVEVEEKESEQGEAAENPHEG
ncbi:hypothetical protein HMN09_00914800 [Mycena chlorophos]|uniref:Protein-S-isoprenylcysteine O-methyltransferase n=1 Tax=Mycena chlorophos TaxID=658473 RepID=A0A8H6SK67_MYCCL|nr:hypothetical protein HMN09_00914800 [Mycena chlorophos]